MSSVHARTDRRAATDDAPREPVGRRVARPAAQSACSGSRARSSLADGAASPPFPWLFSSVDARTATAR